MSDVVIERQGRAGLLTLNRPRALNALSLGMIRELTQALLAWRDDPAVEVVGLRGQGKAGPFGAFCAGGDIRFFHQAVLAGNPELEDFFTEEYTLNHLVHSYPKPLVTFLDGIVMGGGMGISGHGALRSLRIVTPNTRMAMPETNIGLFPDVGGGWFLARCPGRLGEFLGLTGHSFGAADAFTLGLADGLVDTADLPALWETLAQGGSALGLVKKQFVPQSPSAPLSQHRALIDACFSGDSVLAIVHALETEGSDWAAQTVDALRHRSPLMLHVTLEQVRRARSMTLADELRLERGMMRRCFTVRPGIASETMEGIRALAVDKDHTPHWNPARIEDVNAADVDAFFESPWPEHAHPLRALGA